MCCSSRKKYALAKLHRLPLSILLTVLCLLTASITNAQSVRCHTLFDSLSQPLVTIQNQLLEELRSPELTLNELRISEKLISPISFLGQGADGVVFKVNYYGRTYALKIFRNGKLRPKTIKEAVVVQKNLGSLGLAPVVVGVLNQWQIQRWIKKFDLDFSSGVTSADFAVLMELVDDTRSLKTAKEPILLNPSSKAAALKQIEYIKNALHFLQVNPKDYDATVSLDGKIKLLDISDYSFEQDASKRYVDELARWITTQIELKTYQVP